MDKDALSAWVESECSLNLSYRQFALGLGVSPTAVARWRDRKSDRLSPESLQAIALRRKESIAQTAEWLDVEAPVSFDLPKKFNEIEQRIAEMELKVEYAYQRVAQRDEATNPAVLDTYLLQKGVDVRRSRDKEKILAYVTEMSINIPGLFERLLLIITGILPPSQEVELSATSNLLKMLTGEPWTPSEVVRVLSEARVN